MSNLTVRVLVALVGIPIIVAVSYVGSYAFFSFVVLISSLALWEFYTLVEKKGAQPFKWMGLVFGFFLNASFLYDRLRYTIVSLSLDREMQIRFPSQFVLLLTVVALFVFVTLMIELIRKKNSAIFNISTTIIGVLYVSLFLSMLIAIRELFDWGFPYHKFSLSRSLSHNIGIPRESIGLSHQWGGYTVIAIFVCIWICDTAAQLLGMKFGKHKLTVRISPNKSWEGAVAGFFAAIITAIAAKFLVLNYLSLFDSFIIGIIVGVFGQIGDLVESLLKRDAGVKDSSAIIPGHGGMLDRFDSLIFVSPLLYLYFDLVVF